MFGFLYSVETLRVKHPRFLLNQTFKAMYYEINVSLNGKHYFATSERSITNDRQLVIIFKDFYKKFPKKEGYHISVTQRITGGKDVNMELAIKEIEKGN
jgi:hypothetical protein